MRWPSARPWRNCAPRGNDFGWRLAPREPYCEHGRGRSCVPANDEESVVFYSVRELIRRREGAAQQPLPPSTPFMRPRTVGVIAAGIVALAAAAALVWPSATPAVPDTRSAAAVPAAPAALTPIVEQSSSGMDDGIPSGTEVARSSAAAGRHCDHDL